MVSRFSNVVPPDLGMCRKASESLKFANFIFFYVSVPSRDVNETEGGDGESDGGDGDTNTIDPGGDGGGGDGGGGDGDGGGGGGGGGAVY